MDCLLASCSLSYLQVQRLQKQYEEIAALAAAAGLQLDDPLRGGPAPAQKQQQQPQQQKQGAPAAPAAAAAPAGAAAASPAAAAAPVSKAPQPKAIEVGEGGSKVSNSHNHSGATQRGLVMSRVACWLVLRLGLCLNACAALAGSQGGGGCWCKVAALLGWRGRWYVSMRRQRTCVHIHGANKPRMTG